MSHRPHEARRRWWIALAGVCLAAGLAWLGLRVDRALGDLGAVQGQAAEMQAFVAAHGSALLTSRESVASIGAALRVMDAELAEVERLGAPFLSLGPYVGWAPYVGGDLRAAPHLLVMARGLVGMGVELGGLLEEAQAANSAGAGWAPAVTQVLSRRRESTAQLRRTLEQVSAARRQVDGAGLTPRLAAPLAEFDRWAPTVEAGLRGAEALPALLGADGPRVYLILAQNENELRPTGGFITAAGTVRVEGGRITGLDIRDSYAFDDFTQDYPWPPMPLQDYMLAEMWLLRDANWSPDFPESAEVAAELFRLGTGEDVDGVVALDQAALRGMVEAVGEVNVPLADSGGPEGPRAGGGVEPVTAENFADWMHRRWAPIRGQEQDAQWWVGRKSFVGDLGAALRRKVETEADVDVLALLRAVSRALDEKHILLYVRDPAVAGMLGEADWDGRIQQGPGDYLMAVDANVGFNKSNALVERALEQRVVLDSGGGADETVRLTYRHRGVQREDGCDHTSRYDPVYAMMMDRCYWNYLRIVAPAGAELKSAPYIVVPGRSLISGRDSRGTVDVEPVGQTRQSWGQLVLLKPGSELTLEYAYRVPAGAVEARGDQRRYRLTLQKQPGLEAMPTSVEVVLPEGSRLLSSAPQPVAAAMGRLRYTLTGIADETITVDYAP